MPTLAKKRPITPEEEPKSVPNRRPARDDDDDIETTRSRRPAAADDGDDGDIGAEGWGGADEVAVPSGFANNLKLEKGETAVFKFLEDWPYVNVKVHWVQRTGKRSFLCIGDGCPLCALGDIAETQSEHRFNIALLVPKEAPKLRSLNVSYGHAKEFQEFHDGPGGPLQKRYYTRTRPKGAGGRYKHSFFRHAEDVLEEHPKLHVPSVEEIEELWPTIEVVVDGKKKVTREGLFRKSTARKERSSIEELEKIAAELSGDKDYDDD
jgi:hypothetical protein